jgi:hypothetical protein
MTWSLLLLAFALCSLSAVSSFALSSSFLAFQKHLISFLCLLPLPALQQMSWKEQL